MAKVITVDPLFGSIKSDFLQGELWAEGSGYTTVKASYFNWFPFDSNATAAMNALDALLLANPGTVGTPTRVLGFSMGAQACLKWMRQKGPTTTVDPGKVEFYLCGCPEMPYNGASVLYPEDHPAIYPGETAHWWGCPTPEEFHGEFGVGYGPPTVCPWDITFVINEWDGWCDAPNKTGNEKADKNAAAGRKSSGNHGLYPGTSLVDPRRVEWVDPDRTNIKYILVPKPLPLLNSVKDPLVKASEERKLRPIIEAAYDRPMGNTTGLEPDPRLPDEVETTVEEPKKPPPPKPAPEPKPPQPDPKPRQWWEWWRWFE